MQNAPRISRQTFKPPYLEVRPCDRVRSSDTRWAFPGDRISNGEQYPFLTNLPLLGICNIAGMMTLENASIHDRLHRCASQQPKTNPTALLQDPDSPTNHRAVLCQYGVTSDGISSASKHLWSLYRWTSYSHSNCYSQSPASPVSGNLQHGDVFSPAPSGSYYPRTFRA